MKQRKVLATTFKILKFRVSERIFIFGLLLSYALAHAPGATEVDAPDPAALYAEHCIECHGRAAFSPAIDLLANLTAAEINKILWSGSMQMYADGIEDGHRWAIAKWIAGLNPNKDTRGSGVSQCETTLPLKPEPARDWAILGRDLGFTRHVADKGLTAERVRGIRLKWAVAFPIVHAFNGAGNPVSVVGDRVFVGNFNQWVYSLDANSGCAYWTYRADFRIRSNVAVADGVAVFGDLMANVYALDAETGKLLWRAKADWTAGSRITGNLTAHRGRVYVPVSSIQEGLNLSTRFPCCTFRGSVVAYDLRSGAQVWKTMTIDDEPQYLGKTVNGHNRYGPSGVPVWSGISVDEKRGVLYVATGNQFTEPRVAESDAVMALDIVTGVKRWVRTLAPAQMGGQDIYHLGCETWVDEKRQTCSPENPKGQGDRDFGAPAALVKRADGKEIVLAGSKDGMFYGLDPDDGGKVLWQIRVGRGGEGGGIEWGFSTDGKNAYVPVVDMNADFLADGSLTAVDLQSGEAVWRIEDQTPACEGKPSPPCNNAYTAPTTIVGGFVFAGTTDGVLRVLDASNGEEIWTFDTVREYDAVNGRKGYGGSLGFGGDVVSGNRIYQMSGLATFNFGLPGNVLLAFEIPD